MKPIVFRGKIDGNFNTPAFPRIYLDIKHGGGTCSMRVNHSSPIFVEMSLVPNESTVDIYCMVRVKNIDSMSSDELNILFSQVGSVKHLKLVEV